MTYVPRAYPLDHYCSCIFLIGKTIDREQGVACIHESKIFISKIQDRQVVEYPEFVVDDVPGADIHRFVLREV